LAFPWAWEHEQYPKLKELTAAKMKTNFSGYCCYQEIGTLNEKQNDLTRLRFELVHDVARVTNKFD